MFTDSNSNNVTAKKNNQVSNQQGEKERLKEYSNFCRSYYNIVESLSQKINSRIVESNILDTNSREIKEIIDIVNLESESAKNWGLKALSKKFK